MSNNSISVTRDLLERISFLMDNYIGTTFKEEDELRDLLYAAPQPVAQDGWIPISERLPDPGDCWVLVYADGAMNCMAWHDGAWHDWTNAQAHNIFPDEITHWMPLPAAPKGGE